MSVEIITVSAPERTTKFVNVGRAWVNEVKEGSNRPAIRAVIDSNLGAKITLTPKSEFFFFPNKKREGQRDADFRVSVVAPIAMANEIIERQRKSA